MKDQIIFSLVININSILISLSLDNVWLLLGENWCWSLLGIKGLNTQKNQRKVGNTHVNTYNYGLTAQLEILGPVNRMPCQN